MPPFWPFKKKEPVAQIEEAPPTPVVYKRGEDPNARGGVQTDSAAYKDALALFGGGSDKVEAATDQSVHYDGVTAEAEASVSPSEAVTESEEEVEVQEAFTWVHHTDGYHYKRRADGSFEPTPHTKNQDGTYSPYA